MIRIVLADWRRILLFYAAGTALWLVIHLFVVRDFADHCCLQDPGEQPRLLKLLFLELIYASCSVAVWAQGRMYDKCRLKLTETLPLCPEALNRTRILTAAGYFAPTLVNWMIVFGTWRYFDLAIPIWMPVLSLLCLVAYVVLCLRCLALRYVVPIAFPFLFAPAIETRFPTLVEWSVTPWPSLMLAAVVISWAWWALRQPLPRWTRG